MTEQHKKTISKFLSLILRLWEQEKQGELKEVFRDGKLLIDQSLTEIRSRVR